MEILMDIQKITLKDSTATLTIGNHDFIVLMSLKSLQGERQPFFNATEIINQYNDFYGAKKRLSNWTQSPRFKELMKIWETEFQVPKNKLYQKEREGKKYRIMLHKDLFLSLMIWLDARHEFEVTRFLNEIVSELTTVELMRAKRKALQKPMTEQIKILQQILKDEGSGFAPHTYSNIQKWIYFSVTGVMPPKGGADYAQLTSKEEEMIANTRSSVENQIKYLLQSDLTGREIKDILKLSLKGKA